MRFGLYLLFSCMILNLAACSSGPSEDEFAPKVGEIYTAIKQLHSSYYAHLPEDEQRTIEYIVSATITDPDSVEDIVDIYIYDKSSNINRYIQRAAVLSSKYNCRKLSLSVFECTFYSDDFPNTADLSGYYLVAVDRHGYSTRVPFEFKLPQGEAIVNEEFVYSDIFSGGTNNGIPALEALSIVGNSIEFSMDSVGELLTVEFETTDNRVREYAIELYNDSAIPELIGQVDFDRASIAGAPISFGVKTSVDIPWAQIEFSGDNAVTDVKSLRVVLFDQQTVSTQLDVESDWFNYRSYSQLVASTP